MKDSKREEKERERGEREGERERRASKKARGREKGNRKREQEWEEGSGDMLPACRACSETLILILHSFMGEFIIKQLEAPN